ncbi:Glu/Leu/Phe/Val dehydrogenase [Desulfofundulus sp. TPOSR]|uniref:Glu/Leu/Phe/Val family dehydrogenase n=1 Tax=Desulfofundulus sp. TPOSR TaxID=2714340 RepID=UPI00140DF8BB|nr:Glu/Leu/Phe/Val dehydrogenase [Desulfofundulus sp. TPOSR]NHM28615.1 Glu/Leu/Phe/Val dehydrogenase [Desulfofundulus sp. TPOSR]
MHCKKTAWETAIKQLEESAAIAGLSHEILELLKKPQRIYTVHFPVRMDDGTTKIFTGFRVHHCHALGPIRGGTRFHPDNTLEDIKALALWMTIKNSLNGIPAGGGKGGVVCDPATMSRFELERVCRAYIRAISPLIGTWKDFPGADIGTNEQTMSWMLDEWEQIHEMTHDPAAISGKALVLGGSEGRPSATGLGVMFAVRETCKYLGLQMKGLRVAIQGFGKVGSWAARLLYDEGVIIVALSDVYGGILNPEGLSPYEVLKFVEETGSVVGYPKSESITNEELLCLDCNVVIPAAVQSVITEENAPNIKTRIIVEAANGPITPEGEQILLSKGTFIVPDILANGGGTTIAHLERVQGLCDHYWTEEEVRKQYNIIFTQVYNQVYHVAKERNISMRMAAWVKALKRLESAIKARGWV